MSYIGRKPIKIPKDLKLEIFNEKRVLRISSKSYHIEVPLSKGINAEYDDKSNLLKVTLLDAKYHRNWGSTRTLVANAIYSMLRRTGFYCRIELSGIGYRAWLEDGILRLKVGYSHNVELRVPKVWIDVEVPKPTVILLRSFNQSRLYDFAMQISNIRKFKRYNSDGIFLYMDFLEELKPAGRGRNTGKSNNRV